MVVGLFFGFLGFFEMIMMRKESREKKRKKMFDSKVTSSILLSEVIIMAAAGRSEQSSWQEWSPNNESPTIYYFPLCLCQSFSSSVSILISCFG